MKKLYIERRMEQFLRFEDPAYADNARRIMLSKYADPIGAITFYDDWLITSRRLKDSGTQVFVFDPDAQHAIEQTDGALTPKEVYDAFPFDCAYVMIEHPILDGFVVMKDYESEDVGFMFMQKEGWVSAHADDPRKLHAVTNLMELDLEKLCNLTSYIAARNADLNLQYAPPAEFKRKRDRRSSKATVTKVGYRIGAQLREYERSSGSGERLGGTVRPHMRRAHWHRFWTGPMDGERKLVLKWLQPIFVNPDKGDMEPTVREVATC